jgi:hypothetical protein
VRVRGNSRAVVWRQSKRGGCNHRAHLAIRIAVPNCYTYRIESPLHIRFVGHPPATLKKRIPINPYYPNSFVQRIRMAAYQRVIRKSGSWATEVIHLWHQIANKETAERNAVIVRAKIVSKSNSSEENL